MSKAASLRKEGGLIRGYLMKKELRTGSKWVHKEKHKEIAADIAGKLITLLDKDMYIKRMYDNKNDMEKIKVYSELIDSVNA